MKKHPFRRARKALVAAVLALCISSSAAAQQGGTTRYVYDEGGRLHVVITPSGEAVVYDYDAAGNLTAVRRLDADALAIFTFSPREGIFGDTVIFTGIGFGAGVTEVSFNGAPARVVEVTPTTVAAEVPQGATTGPVTITTPRGSVTTTEQFIIRGVIITPTFASIKFGQTVQFTSQVLPLTFDQAVVWSADGVEGGNSATGTIDASGVYTAPDRELSGVAIRATSVADPLLYAEARVLVRDPENVQGVFAASVSVSRGADGVSVFFSPAVSVQRGSLFGDGYSHSPPVSVQVGNTSGLSTALSPGVAVQRRGESGQVAVYTDPPVSVRYGTAPDQNTSLSQPITATTGPVILSVTPASVARGTTMTITLSGANLAGTTSLRFITESGSNDTTITVSNLTAATDGSSLMATLVISSGAALGRRVIVVITPDGSSQFVDIGTNTVAVAAP